MRGLVLLVMPLVCWAGDPPTSEDTEVRTIMIEYEYDASGFIREAQLVGGFKDADACQHAMPQVLSIVSVDIKPGLTPKVWCAGVSGLELEVKPKPKEGI